MERRVNQISFDSFEEAEEMYGKKEQPPTIIDAEEELLTQLVFQQDTNINGQQPPVFDDQLE